MIPSNDEDNHTHSLEYSKVQQGYYDLLEIGRDYLTDIEIANLVLNLVSFENSHIVAKHLYTTAPHTARALNLELSRNVQ